MRNDKRLQDMGTLGPIAICKEAFRLLRAHARLYFWSLQYAVLLPWSIITLVSAGVGSYAGEYAVARAQAYGADYAARNAGPEPGSNSVPSHLNTSVQSGQHVAAVFFLLLALSVVGAVAAAIWVSPVVYSAGLVYAGKEPNLSDALQAIPRFWKPIVVTDLAIFAVYFIILGFASIVAACLAVALYQNEIYVVSLVTLIVSVTQIILIIVFQLAPLVPILGDRSGFAAVWKGRKLLQGKLLAGIGIVILNSIVVSPVTLVLSSAFRYQAQMDPWSFRFLIIGFVQIVYMSLVSPWTCMCEVVLYMSCKAHHGESIDSIGAVEGPDYEQVQNLVHTDV